jgi:HAD superfamily hydrolase (TIGR01509 family)
VVFDCDGVLIDSEPIASRTLADALQEAGVAMSAARSHAIFTGHSETDIRRKCQQELGVVDTDALFARWHDRLFEEFARSLMAMPGIDAVVADLRRPKCVASNSTMARLQRSLGHLPLWHAFAPGVYSAELVAKPKPAPDLLLHCAAQFGASPARCVMIDDSPHGIEAACAAGMVAIGFADPSDPRPGRPDLLKRAGALCVANGAKELPAALVAAGRAIAEAEAIRPGQCRIVMVHLLGEKFYQPPGSTGVER